jgi:hypothetical protein
MKQPHHHRYRHKLGKYLRSSYQELRHLMGTPQNLTEKGPAKVKTFGLKVAFAKARNLGVNLHQS